ncbi:MAG: phytoene desaturase [Actinomycetales bacterium]|nr:phytoene desaturase [Actinomycetales bacterium]
MSRVVVIGGGVGGLAVAARLAVKRHQVVLLERAPEFGGKLATYRRDGFAFDTGPSLFTLPAVYRDLFLKTGRPLEEEVDLQPVEPAFGYHFADGSSVTVPGVDPARAAKAFQEAFGGSAGAHWLRLIERGSQMWRITRGPFLQSPLDGWRTLLKVANPADVRTVAPMSTLRALGRQYLDDWRLRQVLDRYATYSGSDPRRAPAVLATIPYMEETFGAWHLGGGLGTLADALVRRCEKVGVDLRPSTDAVEIVLRDGSVAGVRLASGEVMDADLVVANADAQQVYGHLLEDPRARKVSRDLDRRPAALSGFVMLLAVSGRTPGIRHHNVWFPRDYDAEFDALFGRRVQPIAEPAIYACVPDDPAMRPDADSESWFILINAPRHGDGRDGTFDWDAPGAADTYADALLDQLAARGTDIRARVRWRELRTPADLERRTGAPGGSIYGSASNGARAAFQRPANRSPIPGLYLVGGSAHPGGGLPLVGMGAEIVADLIGRPAGAPAPGTGPACST